MRKDIVIGQEAVCPDGLGRVSEVVNGPAGRRQVRVDTYIRNRGCLWDDHNVTLIPITLEPVMRRRARVDRMVLKDPNVHRTQDMLLRQVDVPVANRFKLLAKELQLSLPQVLKHLLECYDEDS